MSDHPLSRPIQVCAAVVLILTVLAGLVMALGPGRVPEQMLQNGVPVALCVAGGVGLCGILLALMGILDKEVSDPQTRKILTEIRDHLSRANTSVPLVTPETPRPATPIVSPISAGADTSRIVQLLDEIRDISLLDEQQKRTRLQQLLTMRRQTAAAAIDTLIRQQQWADAKSTLQQAQMTFGEGPELAAANNRLLQAVTAAETAAFVELQRRVTDLQAAENWDQVVAESQSFIDRFPDSAPGLEFHASLLAARNQWIDATGNKLYEEVKQNIEQRNWRRALQTAQQLMTRCPGHYRSKQLEFQTQIIRENADTEQRNAMEAQIHELIKAQRLKEAVTLAEELIKAYPLSPQAQIASQLAMSLRDRIEQGEGQTV